MIRKTWHKQLHRRKIYKSYSIAFKTWYYMKPFLIHLLIVWLQPMPMPTIFKVICTMCLLVFILLPFIYPLAIVLASYWVLQYLAERHFGMEFTKDMDLRGYVNDVIYMNPTGQYKQAVYFYFENVKIFVATIATLIDYFRLANGFVFGV